MPTTLNDDVSKFKPDTCKSPISSFENTYVVSRNREGYNNILNNVAYTTHILNSSARQNESHHYHQFPPLSEEYEKVDEIKYEDISSGSEMFEKTDVSTRSINCEVLSNDDKINKVMNSIYEKPLPEKALWNNGTTLIIGDSMLSGVDETRLRNSKVRIYPGATIEDMFHFIFPLLRKKTTNIIVHAGTNNAISDNSTQIIEKLWKLKDFILSVIPNCKVVFSQIIERFDDRKAQLTVNMTNEIMSKGGVFDVIDNSNITREHLGKQGLHMKPHGTGRLAVNIIKTMKRL